MKHNTNPTHDYTLIPAELRSRRQWVCWDTNKVPIATNGAAASITDPTTWDTFEAALAAYQAAPKVLRGIGFVITHDDPYAFIDLDHVKTDQGWNPLVNEVLTRVPSWAEYSQSGEGVHILCQADGESVKGAGVEIYTHSRYVALTGRQVPNTATGLAGADLTWLRERIRPSTAPTAAAAPLPAVHQGEAGEALRYIDPDCGYDHWLAVGMALHHANPDWLELWDAWSSFGTKYPGIEELSKKWASFKGREVPVTLATVYKWAHANGWNVVTARDVFQPIAAPATPDSELFEPAGTLVAVQKPVQWVLRGILEARSMGVVFGPSQAYKTYMMLDLAVHVSLGWAWQGHKVDQPGAVLYIAGEGHSNIAERLEAWRQQHNREHHPHHQIHPEHLNNLYVSKHGVDINDPTTLAPINDLAHQLAAQGRPPALIVVDTWSRNNLGADENSAADVSRCLETLATMSRALNCCTVVVAHSPKDGRATARGSSVFHANSDFYFSMTPGEGPPDSEGRPVRNTRLSYVKVKSGREPLDMLFQAMAVGLTGWVDPDGGTVWNMVLRRVLDAEHISPKDQQAMRGLRKEQQVLLSFTRAALLDQISMDAAQEKVGLTIDMLWDAWRLAGHARTMYVDKTRFSKALTRLIKADLLHMATDDQGRIWVLYGP